MQEDQDATLNVTLTISDPDLDEAGREAQASQLYLDLLDGDLEGVEVHRPLADGSAGARDIGVVLPGVIAAVLSSRVIVAFLKLLGGRPITVEVDGIKLSGQTPEELILAYNAATQLIEGKRRLGGGG